MLKINHRRLHPESEDWVLTDYERVRATVPLTVHEEAMLQTYRCLTPADQHAILIHTLLRKAHPRNAVPAISASAA
jgi:hypothetical protein